MREAVEFDHGGDAKNPTTRGVTLHSIAWWESSAKGAIIHLIGGGYLELSAEQWAAVRPELIPEPQTPPAAS